MKSYNNRNRLTGVITLMVLSGIFFSLQAQDPSPQYLFPKFTSSKVLLKNGASQTVMMNYNMVTERMVYEQDGKKFDLINIGTVDTIYIQNRKFIPDGKVFYEVILKGEPLSLFIQQQGSLMSPGTPAGYGGTSQVAATKQLSSIELAGGRYNLPLPAEYLVNVSPVFWIGNGNEKKSFLNEKQFLKILPEKEKELKAFIKENRVKVTNPDQLAKLVNYYNGLTD